LSTGNLIFNDESIKLLKPVLPRSSYRELHEKDVVILIDLRKVFGGLIDNKARNLLVWNFWGLVTSLLGKTTIDMIWTDGTVTTMRSNYEVNSGSAYVVFGVGTTSESFSQNSLGSRRTSLEGATITPAIVSEADKLRIRFGRVSAGAINEVGLYQYLYDTGGGAHECMLGRKLYSVPGSGYSVYYDIIVKAPMLYNYAKYLLGILTDTDQSVTRPDGSSITARTSGIANASSSYLLIGTSSTSFSFSQYSITNPVYLTSAYNLLWSRPYWILGMVSGATRLSSAMSIGEIGIAQNLYDASGNTYMILLARIVLPTAITKQAGDVFTTAISFYASA